MKELKPITERGGGGVSMEVSFGVGSITAVSLKPITERGWGGGVGVGVSM